MFTSRNYRKCRLVSLHLSFCLIVLVYFKGLAIKVQEQKRDEALNRLVPAAATVIRNWWRLRCAYHGDRYASTWKIYTLIQRRVNGQTPDNPSPYSAPPIISSSTTNKRSERNIFRYNTVNLSTTKFAHHIRRKSIMVMEDLPMRYITAIKILRMLKYSAACKKFQQAKRPIDIKDVVKENTQMNNRLSLMLNDVQRRLDFVLGTAKPASYLSDEQKRQLSLTARIEKVEEFTDQFESKLTYLEQLALTLVENT